MTQNQQFTSIEINADGKLDDCDIAHLKIEFEGVYGDFSTNTVKISKKVNCCSGKGECLKNHLSEEFELFLSLDEVKELIWALTEMHKKIENKGLLK